MSKGNNIPVFPVKGAPNNLPLRNEVLPLQQGRFKKKLVHCTTAAGKSVSRQTEQEPEIIMLLHETHEVPTAQVVHTVPKSPSLA